MTNAFGLSHRQCKWLRPKRVCHLNKLVKRSNEQAWECVFFYFKLLVFFHLHPKSIFIYFVSRARLSLVMGHNWPVIWLAPIRVVLLPLIGWGEAARRVSILVPHRVRLSWRGPSLLMHIGMTALIRTRAVQVVLLHHGFHQSCNTEWQIKSQHSKQTILQPSTIKYWTHFNKIVPLARGYLKIAQH